MAKRTISQLNIKVTADSKGVRKGLNDAKGDMSKFRRSSLAAMKGLAAGAAIAAVAIAGIGLAANKVFQQIKKSADAIDEIVKQARALNVEVAELEAAQLLGEFSGSDAAAVGTSLERMSIAIGDAVGGAGEAADAFAKLGLNAEELAGQSVVKSMEDIGRALQDVGTRAEQLDILGAIVGTRKAGELINTFDAIAGGLGNVDELLESLGGNLTQIEFDNIEEMNDALHTSDLAFKALWRQITAESAPAITEMALATADFLNAIVPLVPTLVNVTQGLVKMSAALSPAFQLLRWVSRDLGLLDGDVNEAFKKAREPIAVVNDELATTSDVLKEISAAAEEAFDPSKIQALKDELAGLKDIKSPDFKQGRTFGGKRGTQGALDAVRDAMSNRNRDIAEQKQFEIDKANRDEERNRLLDELTEEIKRPREPAVRVNRTTMVG